jgi:hypothetical protein
VKDTSLSFDLGDLTWATAGWAATAPGWGGWLVELEGEGECGELAFVYPPGPGGRAERLCGAHFLLSPGHDGGVNLEGSQGERLGNFGTLRRALLALCPLSETEAAAADVLGRAGGGTSGDSLARVGEVDSRRGGTLRGPLGSPTVALGAGQL